MLLVVFSAIVLAIPFVENAIIGLGYPWVLPIVTQLLLVQCDMVV